MKKQQFLNELVSEVKEDFLSRREERRPLEEQWRLNFNYLMGNQYCDISPDGTVFEEEKYYYWQDRNVYNHIAPIVETRVAKLARVRPVMSVRAAGSDDRDLKTAKIATNVLNSTYHRVGLDGVIARATLFSEVYGTAFYKIFWDSEKGRKLGLDDNEYVYEGDVSIVPVSPFEIYPDSLFHDGIENLKSLIHARAMHVKDVYEKYGVKVKGEDIDVMRMEKSATQTNFSGKVTSGIAHDNVIVIERYEMPSADFPYGRVVTVAGDALLAVSDLPFENGVDGKRAFPFVKQESITQPMSFFGTSIIGRLIPVQRAYNAVKNRKHEFINRLSMGVLTVEDGSVDTDELVSEGLSPGKVLVYRQGSTPPQYLSSGNVPSEFTYEEERLSQEFISISGVSEISRNSGIPDSVTSGVALQVLLEQDETRLASTAEGVKRAIKAVAKQILRLFKQFATQLRVMRIAGESQKAETFYFNSSDLTSDDVVFDTENEITTTPAQKKSAVLELFSSGLLSDKDGKLNERTKAKILEIMGFGSLDNANDITSLHISKASKENLEAVYGVPEVEFYDDHDVHVTEHTRFLLSGELDGKNAEHKNRLIEHLRKHKQLKIQDSQLIEGLFKESNPEKL